MPGATCGRRTPKATRPRRPGPGRSSSGALTWTKSTRPGREKLARREAYSVQRPTRPTTALTIFGRIWRYDLANCTAARRVAPTATNDASSRNSRPRMSEIERDLVDTEEVVGSLRPDRRERQPTMPLRSPLGRRWAVWAVTGPSNADHHRPTSTSTDARNAKPTATTSVASRRRRTSRPVRRVLPLQTQGWSAASAFVAQGGSLTREPFPS
jgi:hypothetical protein